MCTPTLALMAVGTGLSFINQQNTLQNEQDAAARAALNQEKFSQQAQQAVNNMIPELQKNMSPGNVQKTTQQYQQQGRSDLAAAINRMQQNTDSKVGGTVSGRFSTDNAKAISDSLKKGIGLANMMGVQDALRRLRQNEGVIGNDLGTQMQTIAGEANRQGITDRANIQAASYGNPVLGSLGDAMTSYAMNGGTLPGGAGGNVSLMVPGGNGVPVQLPKTLHLIGP